MQKIQPYQCEKCGKSAINSIHGRFGIRNSKPRGYHPFTPHRKHKMKLKSVMEGTNFLFKIYEFECKICTHTQKVSKWWFWRKPIKPWKLPIINYEKFDENMRILTTAGVQLDQAQAMLNAAFGKREKS